ENFDPMGVHTGDSITVAPSQTLNDKQYQELRDAAKKVISEIGVETGGSNIQFAVNPDNGRVIVIEMNPRVSRSSALASKATGFPIAKIAAKLAVGYTLDEIPNDITKTTPSCFEPVIDYIVVKIPRWDFDKFRSTNPESDVLGVQMKSVGEVMSFGRNFKEALQKALRSLEIGRAGLGSDGKDIYSFEYISKLKDEDKKILRSKILNKLKTPRSDNIFYIRYAMLLDAGIDEIHFSTKIDKWFLNQIREIIETEKELHEFVF
ncbi:MAG TPA: carbamoyl-phosphate synthase subunit L, partial [Ignavibacteria bacterium]|nr:carbamoyl-phosphate synthase subunit L [Ignavibacteria bacterium]